MVFGGQTYAGIPVDISTADLAVRLQSSPQFGFLNIVRSRDCTGYSYTIEWVANGGAKTAISITNAGSITPAGTTVTASRVQSGGALFKPLSGDITRTYQTNPQVRKSIHETCIYECCFFPRSKYLLVVSLRDAQLPVPATSNGYQLKLHRSLQSLSQARY